MDKRCILLFVGALAGCEDEPAPAPLWPVSATAFNHQVSAQGSLFAVKSKQIIAPMLQSGPGYIAYIAAEYSDLKPGDVVIRFEGKALEAQKSAANYQLQSLQLDLKNNEHSQQTEQQQLALQQQLVQTEFAFADRFAIDDVTIRSRLEILDSMQNKDYLAERQRYLGWQHQSMAGRFAGESGLLQQKSAQQQRQVSVAEHSLQSLELTAPHAGMLVLESDWRGDKPGVGKMVFPGDKVASIPDLSHQQVRLQVIESEAAGVVVGLPVEFFTFSAPKQRLTGKVVAVANAAKSKARRDPRKFVEVVVEPDQQQTWFVPGNRVEALIQVAKQSDVLAVPTQAVQSEAGQSYVWKWQDGTFQRQVVKLGTRGLHQVILQEGVQVGDEIALSQVGD